MERLPPDPSPPPRPGRSAALLWAASCLVLLAWQGWMVLGLFAPAASGLAALRAPADTLRAGWERLRDDEPILSGQHPLHLYHGFLGASSLREYDCSCCYDPAFQAGYPKTPIFDGGSRPAELFLLLGGGDYDPAAYKLGLAACLLGVPLVLFVAARCTGLSAGASCLATGLGLLACWSAPGRRLVETGDLDLMLAALAALLQTALLLHFDRQPGTRVWLGLFLCSCAGWFAHPGLFLGTVLLVLVYYFRAGARHTLSWHLALWAGLLGGIVVNAFWLLDWLTHWWIQSPLRLGVPLLPHRTLPTIWGSPLWGDSADRALAGLLVLGAALGVWLFNETGRRPAARLLGLGVSGLLTLTVAGMAWEPLGTLGTTRLLAPALWVAAVPAAHAFAQTFHGLGWLLGGPWRGVAVVAVCLGAAALAAREQAGILLERAVSNRPLVLGLDDDQRAIVELLKEHTTPAGRVLWEDQRAACGGSHWSALLPLLTGRAFIGGLDLDRCIEHGYLSFSNQTLAGRPVGDWADGELRDFARRYAVGWAACWSPAAVARFRAWSAAEAVAPLPGGGWLFALPPPSFTLKGQATLVHADARRIVFTDVVPDEDGTVVLSLHYQAGQRATPSQVRVEREPDPHDPIPLVRLRLSGPVSRVTLTWQGW